VWQEFIKVPLTMNLCLFRYAEKGLRILAFPSNQFRGQEPDDEATIKEFVKGFDVGFDMFSKIDVNGTNTHPLYVFLKEAKAGFLGNRIKWNFTKFLCDKNGVPYKRYAPTTSPKNLEKDITALLETSSL
jgi:glutathione peroxidase-family protein